MKHFTVNELTHSDTAVRKKISNMPNVTQLAALRALVDNILDPLREKIGKPIIVNSGFRSAALNREVKGSSTSQHLRGEAADIVVRGVGTVDLCKTIMAMGLPYDQLIEEHGLWVHVSFSNRNRREVLTARKNREGRTYYQPGLTRA